MPKAKAPAKKSQFNAPHFQSVEAARTYLEALRWGTDRVCPHCGTVNSSFATKKPGVYRCQPKACRKDFSVTTKSVMESSHIKLNVWLQAFFLMASSKKGVSSHQLHRALGITYKSAWFLTHRIREAMRSGGLLPPMGGAGKTVEVDETFIGQVEGFPKKRGKGGWANKNVVLIAATTKLEARMGDGIAKLLNLEFKYGRLVTARMDATGLIKMLREAGELRLSTVDFHQLSVLCDRIDIRREDRNLIVHGSWGRILAGNIPHAMSLRLKGGGPEEIISEQFSHKRMQELIADIRSLNRTLVVLLKLPTYEEKPSGRPPGE